MGSIRRLGAIHYGEAGAVVKPSRCTFVRMWRRCHGVAWPRGLSAGWSGFVRCRHALVVCCPCWHEQWRAGSQVRAAAAAEVGPAPGPARPVGPWRRPPRHCRAAPAAPWVSPAARRRPPADGGQAAAAAFEYLPKPSSRIALSFRMRGLTLSLKPASSKSFIQRSGVIRG